MRKGVCTTIEQSKRLLDHGISPVDTADFLYSCIGHNPEILHYPEQWREGHWKSQMDAGAIPGWSLSALVEMLPSRLYYHGEEYFMEFFRTPKGEWIVQYPRQQFLFPIVCHQESFESPVEAVLKEYQDESKNAQTQSEYAYASGKCEAIRRVIEIIKKN